MLIKRITAISIIVILIGVIVYGTLAEEDTTEGGLDDGMIHIQPEGVDVDTTPIEVGDVPPNFQLKTLDGETAQLQDYKGKKVFINFWATYCPPCREEMPDLQKLHDEYDNVEVLAVNAANLETSEDKVSQFVDELNLNFPILLDESGEVNLRYQAMAIPVTYFINTEGVVQLPKRVGAMSYEQMEEIVEELD